jgi:Mn-dependent DtxR family transcriptional regulator
VSCIRTAEHDPNEVTLSQATANALLLAGMVQYASYRRVKITEEGQATVRRLTGGEP